MTYRNYTTTDGRTFQYVIGRKYVKIRGGRAIPLHEIGYRRHGLDRHGSERFIVTPGSIKEYIENGQINQERLCANHERHGCAQIVTCLSVSPYAAEIAGKYHYGFWCDDCLNRNAEDI